MKLGVNLAFLKQLSRGLSKILPLQTPLVAVVVVVIQSLNHVQLFVTPWTVAYQAPQSMEFSRQEYWSGLPFRKLLFKIYLFG